MRDMDIDQLSADAAQETVRGGQEQAGPDPSWLDAHRCTLSYPHDGPCRAAEQAGGGLDVLASDEFCEAVRIVFEKPGEWGPGQGYYRHFIGEFIQLLRQEYDRLAAAAAAEEQR